MSNQNNTGWWILGAGALGLLAYLGVNQAKKFMGMVEYSIASFKVHSVTIFTTKIKLAVLIKNPSSVAVNVKNYKVELYNCKSGTPDLLSTSNVTSLVIPASGNIINDIAFDVDNIKMVNILGSLISNVITGKTKASDVLTQISEKNFKGNLMIKIKADVAGSYIEKEIKY